MNVKNWIKKYMLGGKNRELKVEIGGLKWELEKLKKDNQELAQELLVKKQSLYNWEEFKKTKPIDIQNTLVTIKYSYPEFIDMLKTYIISTRNSISQSESILKDERRYMLFGEKRAYEKLLKMFDEIDKKVDNVDKS